MALAAVLTQALVLSTAGALVPVAELLVVGYGARQHVRKNALQHLHQEITITRKLGSFTLEESLSRLVHDGLLRSEENTSELQSRQYLVCRLLLLKKKKNQQ